MAQRSPREDSPHTGQRLRTAILPDMVEAQITDEERERRWGQLADMYLAQQMSHYPPEYIKSKPTPERMLETVERFEEDLTDVCRVYSPMTAMVQVGKAIPVSPAREGRTREDPSWRRSKRNCGRCWKNSPNRLQKVVTAFAFRSH